MKNLDLKFSVPIRESFMDNEEFIINGTAINATITENGHKFLKEELQNSTESLNGVPLLIDHRNEVSAIKGRVLSGEFDEANEKIDFRAKVIDKEMQELINDGRLNSVSVGATVKELEETDDYLIPRGIIFKELSLVAVPADGGATFGVALMEAYQKNKSCLNDQKEVKMSEEENAPVEDKPEEKPAEAEEESKEESEAEENKEEPKEDSTTEMLRLMSKQLSEIGKRLDKLEESDEDEKTEKEAQEETPKETESESESESEEPVEEGFKIVEGQGSLRGGSFTVVR